MPETRRLVKEGTSQPLLYRVMRAGIMTAAANAEAMGMSNKRAERTYSDDEVSERLKLESGFPGPEW